MPYARCPDCGRVHHLNVGGDVAAWYRERFPECKVGTTVPAVCAECFTRTAQAGRSASPPVPAK